MMAQRRLHLHCIVILGLLATTGPSRPQEFDAGLETGKAEYLANCANCHGADGKGSGPHSAALKTRPADLTALAKHNHGVFPVAEIYRLVDGRGSDRKHLADEMPIWGCRQSSPQSPPPAQRRRHSPAAGHKPSPGPGLEAFMNMTCDPETTIQRRIMSIVAYLSYIQTK